MEFDTKYREDLTYPPLLLPNTYLKPEIEDEFSFESSSFQEFHHLDQFSPHGSSMDPEFGAQNPNFDPFDPFLYNGSSNLDFYELKPFSENGGGGLMQNFQGGGGGHEYVNYPNRTTPAEAVAADRGVNLSFHYQDVEPMNFVIPDEGSCITAENGYFKEIRMKKSVKKPYNSIKGRKKSHSAKGQWTIEEDRLLIHLVEKHGMRKWSHIAQMLKGRIGKQCRERWHNHLRPNIKKDVWTEEEDRVLIQTHSEVGNKWAEIAKRLPGRTENSIKNHWNATKRRQYSRRKCRSKHPRPSSLLQNYIKSLNLDGLKKPENYSKISSVIVDDPPKLDSKATTQSLMETSEFSPGDRLVPDYDFNDVPEFSFDAELLGESDNIDSLLDELPCPPIVDHEEGFDMDMASLMQCDIKKELDLVEMISQVNL